MNSLRFHHAILIRDFTFVAEYLCRYRKSPERSILFQLVPSSRERLKPQRCVTRAAMKAGFEESLHIVVTRWTSHDEIHPESAR
jgi:hypothetical protein